MRLKDIPTISYKHPFLHVILNTCVYMEFWILKALCHAISADCLLIEAARAHAVNEHWAWRMADKFACTFESAR